VAFWIQQTQKETVAVGHFCAIPRQGTILGPGQTRDCSLYTEKRIGNGHRSRPWSHRFITESLISLTTEACYEPLDERTLTTSKEGRTGDDHDAGTATWWVYEKLASLQASRPT